jgi:hypothetical protein
MDAILLFKPIAAPEQRGRRLNLTCLKQKSGEYALSALRFSLRFLSEFYRAGSAIGNGLAC